MSTDALHFGADSLLRNPSRWRPWQRVALVTNDAARLAASPAICTRVALQQAGVPLVRLFGPEHGLGASAADGAPVTDGGDPCTSLPVTSLYGERMRPSAEHLAGLDALLFDIPDVGARFYTYAWTLWHVLHACADANVPLIVLDRPNPLGGVVEAAEGPLLSAACRSFIGEDDIPVRHSLTLGELARLWQREHCPAVSLEVVPCEGWQATCAWPATHLPWVPTSPAMQSFDSAVWYPGTCLFEATNVSVGRGTAAPFAQIGAPWLEPERVIDALTTLAVARGVRVAPSTFTPDQGPHAGQPCTGVRLSLADTSVHAAANFVARELRPVALGLHLLHIVARQHAGEFAWATYPTAANPSGDHHLARLVGRSDIASLLLALDETQRASTLASWTRVDEWGGRVSPVLLYDRSH